MTPNNPKPLGRDPRRFYFGPWDEAGHYMRSDEQNHRSFDLEERRAVSRFNRINPWGLSVDGGLCPTVNQQKEGIALLHHREGWTALSFWDRTIDDRTGSSSTYLAEGEFTFEQMVEMAKSRFAQRWNKMKFQVRLEQ